MQRRAAPLKKQSDKRISGSFSIGRFIAFYVLYIAGMMIFLADPVAGWLNLDKGFSIGEAVTSAQFLRWLGIQCHCDGRVLQMQGASLSIEFGCNGLEAIMILAAGILAYPGSWKRKGWGLLTGFILLQILNWMRIVLLAAASQYSPAIFEILHVYVAQGVMIVLALLCFIIYVQKAPASDGG